MGPTFLVATFSRRISLGATSMGVTSIGVMGVADQKPAQGLAAAAQSRHAGSISRPREVRAER